MLGNPEWEGPWLTLCSESRALTETLDLRQSRQVATQAGMLQDLAVGFGAEKTLIRPPRVPPPATKQLVHMGDAEARETQMSMGA